MSQPGNPGKSTGKAKTRRTDAAGRSAKALELRLSGLDYAEIAVRLGYRDKSGAWRAVEGELSKVRHEHASQVLALDLSRLDALLHTVWDKAIQGDLPALDRALKVLERRARYFDLDGKAGSTADQLRAVQELAFADALAQLAHVKDEIAGRLTIAAINELSDMAHGMPQREIPWEDATIRLEAFNDGD